MIQHILDAAIVVSGAALLLLAAAGGVDLDAGPLHIRLHDWMRPAVLLAAALAVRVYTGTSLRRSGTEGPAEAARTPRPADAGHYARLAQLALLLAVAIFYIHKFVPVAGGLDSYGYVSAAKLLRSGHISEPQRLVSLLPFENASTAAAQLGYVPGPDRKTSVPRFPLGLPVVMTGFYLFGPQGPFYVPLVMAFILGGLGYAMARDPAEPHPSPSGLLCVLLIFSSPLMFVYSTQPMSDVPAACWLLGAMFLMLGERGWPIAAGLCAGMAVLTRPALLVPAGVLALVSMDSRLRNTTKYCAVLGIFVLAQMLLNVEMYGRAGESGYGPASYMFDLSLTRFAANASNFAKWLTYSHTPIIWLAWPASLIVLRHSRWAWQVSAVAAGALVPYFFYLVFDDWESSRFILPAILLVIVLAARAIYMAAPRTTVAVVVITILVFGVTARSHRFLDREAAFIYGLGESKYPLTGAWFLAHTSDRAVVLAGLHSGSIRFYANRETIRWDQMPSGSLGATLRSLVAAGYEPYLVIDTGGEPPLFSERFKSEPDVKFEQVGRVRVVNIYRFLSAS